MSASQTNNALPGPAAIPRGERKNTFTLPNIMNPGTNSNNNNSNNSKSQQFRPESPRTKQACLELGIQPSQFVLKDIESFRTENCSEEMMKLRYNHYLERIQQDVKDVQEQRKHNIKVSRQKLANIVPEALLMQDAGARRSIIATQSMVGFSQEPANRQSMVKLQPITSPNQMNKSMSESRLSSKQMKSIYNRTVGYLKSSHDRAEVSNGEEVLPFDENEGSMIEYQLANEIDKYNRLKMQKQKEARLLLEEDIERVETLERMREKEIRLIEQANKLKKEKELQKEMLKKQAEEKNIKVKETEKKYERLKKQEREKIAKRLEIAKQRQQKETEERDRLKKDQEERTNEKRLRMIEIRNNSHIEMIKACDIQGEQLNQQLEHAKEAQKQILDSKVFRLKEKLEQEQMKVEQLKDLRESNEKLQLSRLVQKLVEREEFQQEKQLKELQAENERKKLLKQKADTTETAKKKVKTQQNSKISELKQKFQKIEENLQRKKKEEQERILLKQQLRELKEQDKQENNDRKRRKDDYRLEKLMEKEKMHADKIQYIKEQQELLKRAKQEVSQQTKQESERIFESMKKAADTLFPNTGPNQKISLHGIPAENKEKGVNLLKTILPKEQLNLQKFEPPVKEDPTKKQQQA